MLPAWATVVLSLVSALAGVGGGVLVTRMRIGFDREQARAGRDHDRSQQERQLAHEREERWRDRLVRAADDFSTGISQAILGVHDAIAARQKHDDPTAAIAEADRVIGEAIARSGRIKLLFQEDSEVVRIAESLLPRLSTTLNHVRGGGAEKTLEEAKAWEELEKLYELHKKFNSAALEMLRSPRWTVSASFELPYEVESSAESKS